MSYDTVLEKVKTLPETCLEDVSKYLDFIQYQYAQTMMEPLFESKEELNTIWSDRCQKSSSGNLQRN